jgi:hypothetical protein
LGHPQEPGLDFPGIGPRLQLGHSNLETTMAYFHLTQKGMEDAYQIINGLMKGFEHGNA